jgi:hypothetical protein
VGRRKRKRKQSKNGKEEKQQVLSGINDGIPKSSMSMG